jgi:hypothetical protein
MKYSERGLVMSCQIFLGWSVKAELSVESRKALKPSCDRIVAGVPGAMAWSAGG